MTSCCFKYRNKPGIWLAPSAWRLYYMFKGFLHYDYKKEFSCFPKRRVRIWDFFHSHNAWVPSALSMEVNGLRREASPDSKTELLFTSIPPYAFTPLPFFPPIINLHLCLNILHYLKYSFSSLLYSPAYTIFSFFIPSRTHYAIFL